MDHLLPEAEWQRPLQQPPAPESWLAALSQATGIYFFPSREWPARLVCWLRKVGVTRLLEAGAGRGYLSAALARLARAAGLTFAAIDKGEGEFACHLPGHPSVAAGESFSEIFRLRPQAVLYAWPPPASPWRPGSLVTACGIFWWRGNRAGGSPAPGRIGNASPIKNPSI